MRWCGTLIRLQEWCNGQLPKWGMELTEQHVTSLCNIFQSNNQPFSNNGLQTFHVILTNSLYVTSLIEGMSLVASTTCKNQRLSKYFMSSKTIDR